MKLWDFSRWPDSPVLPDPPRSVLEIWWRSPPSPPDHWLKDAQREREREWKNVKETSPKQLWNLPATYDQTNASTTNRLRPKFCCLVGQWCVGVAGVWETSSKTLFGLEPLHTRRLQQQVQHSRQPSSATGDCQSSPLGAPWLRIFQRPWNSSDGPMRGLYISGESKKNLCRHRHFSSKLAIEESLRASDFSDTLFHTFLSDLIWNCPALWMEPWHLCLNFWMTNYRTCRWHIFLILWICSHLLWRSFPITCNELFLYWTVLVLKYSFAELFSQVNFLDKWLHSDRLFGHGYTSWWMSFGSPSEMGPWHHSLRPIDPGRTWR